MKFNPVAKGLVVGLVGGFAASWAMNKFQMSLAKMFEDHEKPHGAQALQSGSPQRGIGVELTRLGVEDQDDNAAEHTANIFAIKVFNEELSKDEKKISGEVVHYVFGATTGAVYGAISEIIPQATTGGGSLFGTGVWLMADEVIVPAIGLFRSPGSYPASKHAYAFASHLVYGLTADILRRIIKQVL